MDEQVLEPTTFEIVEPAAAIQDDVEAAVQEPAQTDEVTADPADESGEPFTERRAVARDDRSDDGSEASAESEAEQPAASRLRDELDAELLEVFLTEAAELLPSVATNLRGLASNPNDGELARDLMRKLHTVKGSARMAGAMRLGEAVHEMETRIEAAMQLADIPPVIIDDLHSRIRPCDGAVRRAAKSDGCKR